MCVMMPMTNALRGWRLKSLAHARQKQTEQGGDTGSFPAKRDLFARPAPMRPAANRSWYANRSLARKGVHDFGA
jgi:hypothetical protein